MIFFSFEPKNLQGSLIFRCSDKIFIKYPKKEASWTTYIEPLSIHLWLAIAGMICLIQAAAYLTVYIAARKKSGDESLRFGENLVIIWGSITQQGAEITKI